MIIVWILVFFLVLPVHADDEFELLMNHGSIILMIDPETGDILFANNSAAKFYGYSLDELLKMNISHLNTLSTLQIQGEMTLAVLEERNFFEFKHVLHDGTIKDVDVYTNPIEYKGKTVLFSIIIDQSETVKLENNLVADVEINKRLLSISLGVHFIVVTVFIITILLLYRYKKRIVLLKTYDQLTKTYNSKVTQKVYNTLVNEGKLPIALYVVDMNNLKFINDAYGHTSGDTMIVKTAEMLKHIKYRDAIISRVSGGEFTIMLPDCAKVTEDVLESDIRNFFYRFRGIDFNLSTGSYLVETSDIAYDHAFSKAESKMYLYKSENRKQVSKRITRELMNQLYLLDENYKHHSDFSEQVAGYLSRALELSKLEVETIETAAKYQNISISTLEEHVAQNGHPEKSFLILNALGYSINVANAVYYHHESYDGTGYPKGMYGHNIPLSARILSITNGIYEEWQRTKSFKEGIKNILITHSKEYDHDLLRIIKSKYFIDFLTQLEL